MKKGFTLIELLAVIVVLAIIALIAVPRIMDAIDESRAGALRQNNEAVIKAVQNYFVENAIDLPQEVGETTEVSLNALIQNDLINEISSPYSSNNCSGYVLITKTNGGHDFVPHINCFEDINSSSEDMLMGNWMLIGNTLDYTPSNNHGEIFGDVLVESNEVVTFVNGGVETNFMIDPNKTEFSISLNVSIHNLVNSYLVNQWQSGHAGRLIIRSQDDRLFSFLGISRPGHNIEAETFYHVTLVREPNGTIKFYIDGVLIDEYSNTATIPSRTVEIGGTQKIASRNSNSSIYDVRVYERALSSDEIMQLYNQANRGMR